MKYYGLVLSLFLLAGCGDGDTIMETVEETMTRDDESMEKSETLSQVLYYGDIINDTVVALNIDRMMLDEVIDSNGHYPYEVALGFGTELFVINRKDYTIGVLETVSNEIVQEIALDFYPRSVKINNTDLFLTSANEPAGAVVTSNTASASYSDSDYVEPVSYGGSNATGHPVWVDDTHFLLLDRTENTVELYEKDNFRPIDKFITKSSVHHVMLKDGIFYGVEEGEQNATSPGILKFSVVNGKINVLMERLLSDLSGLPDDFNAAGWGAHHAAFHPTEAYIYMGSTEGNVFVMDLENLNLVDTFKAGKGVGHITFHDNLLITTNHYDTFKSFYDASNPKSNTFLKNIYFGNRIYADTTMQSHTTHIVDNKMYFMYNTDHDSTLFEVNLDRLNIERKLTLLNHYCLMGSFMASDVESDM